MNTHLRTTGRLLLGSRRIPALAAGVVLTALTNAPAQEGLEGWYATLGLGYSLPGEIEASADGVDVELELNVGVRLDLAAGYTFYSGSLGRVAAEFETGLIYRTPKEFTAAGETVGVEGNYFAVPLLVNVVGTFDGWAYWRPYAGVGVGGMYQLLSVDQVGETDVEATGDGFDPAFQFLAGLRYPLGRDAEVSFSYKYLAAFSGGSDLVGIHCFTLSYTVHF